MSSERQGPINGRYVNGVRPLISVLGEVAHFEIEPLDSPQELDLHLPAHSFGNRVVLRLATQWLLCVSPAKGSFCGYISA